MQVLIGRFATSDSKLILSGTDSQISDSYLFQQGDIYRRMETRADGSMHGEIEHVADGIRTHAVIQSGDSTLTISGKFPPFNMLLLYS
jgi:hypothetical protein